MEGSEDIEGQKVFDPGGIYYAFESQTPQDVETDQYFFDPDAKEKEHTYVELDFNYECYAPDCEVARFLCHLDYDVLLGKDREFDALAYAIQSNRAYRMETRMESGLKIPDNLVEKRDSDSVETVKTSNKSDRPERKAGGKVNEAGSQLFDMKEGQASEPPDPGEIIEESTPRIEKEETIPPKDPQGSEETGTTTIQPCDGEFPNEMEEQVSPPTLQKLVKATLDTSNPETLRPYLAYMPIRVVKETLSRTTQLAKTMMSFPLMKHVKSRFAWMNRFRLNEKVSTDTIFANCRSVGGSTCAQVYYGMTSQVITVHGMRSEAEFPNSYSDFLRSEGIPTILRRDFGSAQRSRAVQDIQRRYTIGDEFSEPHHQQQNPVERNAIRWLKIHSKSLLDLTGAPEYLWLQAMRYLADVHNHTAKENLRWAIPLTVRHGDTRDISSLLAFRFYEPVYYLDYESFPSTSEKLGHWIGVARNVGDALTYEIYSPETGRILNRSTVRPAKPNPNFRLGKLPKGPQPVKMDAPKDGPTSSMLDEQDISGTASGARKSDLGKLMFAKEKIPITIKHSLDTNRKKAPVKGGIQDTISSGNFSKDDLGSVEVHDKGRSVRRSARNIATVKGMFSSFYTLSTYFTNVLEIPRCKNETPIFSLYEIADLDESHLDLDKLEEIEEEIESARAIEGSKMVSLNSMNRKQMENFRYANMCESFSPNPEREIDKMWTPVRIVGQVLRRRDPKDIHIRLKILWLNGETSWVRMEDFQMEHPDMIVNYAFDNDLSEFKSFRWTKLYKSIRDGDSRTSLFANTYEARAMVASRYDPQGKYKFGVEVPLNVRHAIKLDLLNGDSKWKEAIAKELTEINHHKTFRLVDSTDDMSTFQRIPYHIVFDVKFDGRRKARLVCGGNFTSPPKEDTYSGVVGIGTVHLAFQLALLNGLQVCAADVGTAFLYGKTR
ncbi:MAG: hypothetical protein AAF587_44235, partial [Bacteroidota bacterium]